MISFAVSLLSTTFIDKPQSLSVGLSTEPNKAKPRQL
nr:MAG TPA: hypothetical protein [Caudoviricetes sp.]